MKYNVIVINVRQPIVKKILQKSQIHQPQGKDHRQEFCLASPRCSFRTSTRDTTKQIGMWRCWLHLVAEKQKVCLAQ